MSGVNWMRLVPDQELQALIGSGCLGDVRVVSIKTVSGIIENTSPGEPYGRPDQRNRYIAFDPISMMWIACDNRTGDAFVEEFKAWQLALAWLNEKLMRGGPNGWEPVLESLGIR